jgi:LEA14-like dessication related protein
VSCGLSFDLPVAGRTRIPVRHTGSLPLVKLPRVTLNGLRVKDLSLMGATVEIVLGVDNPNAFDLALKRVDYALDINGASWATGRTQRTDSVARKQRGELRIPVTLDFLRIGSGIYDIVSGSSQVSYKLSGSLDVGTSLPLLRQAIVPISGTGSIRLSR